MNYYNKFVLQFVFLLQTATVFSQKVVLIVDVGTGYNDPEDVTKSKLERYLPYSIADFTVAAADFNPSYAGFLTGKLQLSSDPVNYIPTTNLHSVANRAGIATGHFGVWNFKKNPDASNYKITVDPKIAIESALNFMADTPNYLVTIFMPPLSDLYIPANSSLAKGDFGHLKVPCYNNKPASYNQCSRFPYVAMMNAKDDLLGSLFAKLKRQAAFVSWAPVHGGIDPHTDALSAPKTSLRGKQFSLFDGGIRVQFRYDSAIYSRLRADGNSIDMARTLLSIFNLAMPDQQGINLFDPDEVRKVPLAWYTSRAAEGNCVSSSPAFAEQQIINGRKIKILYDADPNNDQAYDWNMGYESQQAEVNFKPTYPRPAVTIPLCKNLVAKGITRNMSALPKKSKSRPNIVVILVDDFGLGDLGYYSNHKSGKNYPNTPNIDRLFGVVKDKGDVDKSGVECTEGHSAASVCTPSRYAMVTGRHPSNKFNPIRGVYAHTEDGASLDIKPPYVGAVGSDYNIFKYFKGDDYKVCHYGKWHISDPKSKKMPSDFGVDPDCYKIHSGYAPPDQTYLFTQPYYKAHSAEIITTDVLKALDRINDTQPFFINVWYSNMHTPFMVEPGQLATVGFDNSNNPYLINRSQIFTAETPLQIYNGLVNILDHNIGRLLDRINKNPGADGTIVIFHSDNGAEDRVLSDTSVGDKGPFRGQKRTAFEGGHHVPTNIRWITKAGNVFRGSIGMPVASYDFFPTVVGLRGDSVANIPGYQSLDGIDLSSCLLYDQCDFGRVLRWETTWPNRGDCSEAGGRFALKWGNHSCVARATTKVALKNTKLRDIRCYDSARGPLQFHDIAPTSPRVVDEFKEYLIAWPNYDTKYFPSKLYSNPGSTSSRKMRVDFVCH